MSLTDRTKPTDVSSTTTSTSSTMAQGFWESGLAVDRGPTPRNLSHRELVEVGVEGDVGGAWCDR